MEMEFPELPRSVDIDHPLIAETAAASLGVPADQVTLTEQAPGGNAHGPIERHICAEANGEDVRLVYSDARWRVI